MKLPRDLYTYDGRLLLKKGAVISPALIAKLRKAGDAHREKRIPISRTFVFKDFKKVFSDPRYATILKPPVSKSQICAAAGRVRMESDLIRELSIMKRSLPYTYEHVLVVSALSIKIALGCRAGKYNRMMVAHCGFTHDIGKTRIPIEILNKREKLTKEERDIIETHPMIGYLLLNYYLKSDRRECALASLEHHERADGTGYPKGIRKIRKYTRLISVIDVFDALMAKRPYRKEAFSLRATIDYLVQQAKEDKLDWNTVKMLIRYARKDRPDLRRLKLSRTLREPLPEELSHEKYK